ncbi:TetR/AcrR family transcriptional regulator C-terminal domain-containing protein [Streptomyces sp. CB01373]|nr:TetR/AcrR family transcriptional regulator C-terminal domain-containing protein [Streptomyces sp. CB01373]
MSVPVVSRVQCGPRIFADYEQHFTEGLELVIDGIAARYGID